MNAAFQCGQGHFNAPNGITGPTEFIISIVNSVKIVNIPLARLPHLEEEKVSVYY